MTRYIIMNSDTGYIVGDTAAYAEGLQISSPMDAVRLLDRLIGDEADGYVEYGSRVAIPGIRRGYYVYSADTDEVPIITDGTDHEQIAAVERSAKFAAFVRRRYDHDWDYS
jgi:hypothetical protein